MNKSLLCVPLLVLLASCEKTYGSKPVQAAQLNADMSSSAVMQESEVDRAIRERVQLALSQERQLAQDLPSVYVISQDGVVTLDGTVSSEANKERFGIVTNAVGSVVRVDNRLEVRHP